MQPLNRLVRNIAKAAIRRPRGFDLYHDLGLIIPEPKVIFDVGANVGQSAKRYLKEFPHATIYSFEPVATTFRQLVANVGSLDGGSRFRPEMCALGAEERLSRMNTIDGPSDMFQIVEGGNEEIRVSTLDRWGDDIDHIDFMKIDTEGHDLEVLKGGEAMLRDKRISAIQVEAGMNPDNDRHIPLEVFKSFLEPRGYYLFGVYDQVDEFFTGEPYLRRCNPVFVKAR